jgi:hypothetical protein
MDWGHQRTGVGTIGQFYYRYLIENIYSRKIVSYYVHEKRI